MAKKLLFWISTVALLLSACSPATQTQTSPASTQGASMPPAQASVTRQPGCTAQSRQQTPNPTMEAMLPPVGENDWVIGSENAYVTIIEYSDFQ